MNLLQMSFSASVLILMAVAFRKFFSDRIPGTHDHKLYNGLWRNALRHFFSELPEG